MQPKFHHRLQKIGLCNGNVPIPVALLSKVWVYGRLLSSVAGSNPAGERDVGLL